MAIFFIIVVTLLLFFGSRFLFGKWVNPLSIYVIPWGVMLTLYEVNFLRYYELSTETWLVIISALFSFIAGILLIKTTFTARENEKKKTLSIVDYTTIFKYLVIVFGIIGLVDALQHWSVLFRMYGSLPGIFLNANEIYRLRIEQKIPGLIPYLVAFSYAAIFFAAIYSACKGRITLISLLPIVGVVLKEVANVGRAGIMLAFLIYLLTYFFARNILKEKAIKDKRRRKFQILGVVTVVVILIAGATLIRSIRGTYENFAGASKVLSKTRGGLFITPSIYLYFSAHVGVLNQFLKDQNVNKNIGENTFLTAYSVLSKFDLVERPSDYQKGYRIPLWINTGTYLREVIEDFGYVSIFLFPFILGLISTYYWYRFLARQDLISLFLLTYTCSIIGTSFLTIITRVGIWTISFMIILTAALIMEHFKPAVTIKSEPDVNSKGIK
jgi:oligosaccharide repeat unit polymerase